MAVPAVERLVVSGPAGNLETVIECRTETPSFVALVCHPHPLFSGTMNNKVVTTLARSARDAGGVAVRFNFRGVGASSGAYGEGFGETEDVLAVLSAVGERYPQLPLWLAGFSFGSFVAARSANVLADNGQPPCHLLLVAPPVHNFDFSAIEQAGCPVTVVQSDDDEVVPAAEVYRWVEQTPLAPELVRVSDAGHFFHGKLVPLAAVATSRMPGQPLA